MKKVNLKNKLALNKETIARLNNDEMNIIKGGEGEAKPTFGICPVSGSAFKCCIPPSKFNCPSFAC